MFGKGRDKEDKSTGHTAILESSTMVPDSHTWNTRQRTRVLSYRPLMKRTNVCLCSRNVADMWGPRRRFPKLDQPRMLINLQRLLLLQVSKIPRLLVELETTHSAGAFTATGTA